MAVSIDAIILARRPSTVIDARVNTLKELAAEQMSASAWGGLYNQGVALLVCHWLELDSRSSGAVGSVTAEREGQLSRSYGGYSSDEDLGATTFGAEYIRLRKTIPSFMTRGMGEMPKSNNASF